MILKKLMISCKKSSELIDKSKIDRLDLKERIKLSLHKRMCKFCTLYEKQSEFIDKALQVHFEKGKISKGIKLDNEAMERIHLALLNKEE